MRIFHRSQPRFSSLLLTRFITLTVAAVIAVSYFGSRPLGDRIREDAEEHLRESALRVCEGLEKYLDLHRRAILGLSLSIRSNDAEPVSRAHVERALQNTQRIYPGFLTLLVTGGDGRILYASTPSSHNANPVSNIGLSVADRDYFREARATGRPFFSGIFQGRGLGKDPIVAISAPMLDTNGRFLGIIEGSIDVTRLPLSPEAIHTRTLVVAQDAAGRVVFSSQRELHRPLEKWEPYPLGASAANSPFLLADPAQRGPDGDPIPLYSVRFPLNAAGWLVVAALPEQEVRADANLFFRRVASVLLLVFIFALELSHYLAGSIDGPIVALARTMKEYQLDAPAPPLVLPRRTAREITDMQGEFFRLATRLRDSYQQLRTALVERDRTNVRLQELLAGLDRKVAERTAELAESEIRYRQVVESSGDIIIQTDAFGRITFHNPAFALFLTDRADTACAGRSQLQLIDPPGRKMVRDRSLQQIRQRTPNIYLEYSVTGPDGATRWIGQSTQLLQGPSRFPLGFQAIARDITENKLAERALSEAEERYSLAVQGSNNGIWDWDLRTGFVYFSPRWRQMFGLSPEEDIHTPEDWFSRIHPEDARDIRSTIRSYIQEGQDYFEAEHRMRHADGTWRWILVSGAAVRGPDSRALRIAGSKTDITTGKLADPLTGLPNRLSLVEVLDSWCDSLREDSTRPFSVLFLDFDRFKLINDSLGHLKCDHLLLGASHRLSAALQPISNAEGVVARIGGDEFVILLETNRAPDAPVQLAAAIMRTMEPAFHLDGSLVFVSSCVGIAHFSPISSSPENLLRDADTAMYYAKGAGRGRFAVFDRAVPFSELAPSAMEPSLHQRQSFRPPVHGSNPRRGGRPHPYRNRPQTAASAP